MAQVAKPFGFAPVRTLDANMLNQQATRYYIPSSDGSAFYIGDMVKVSAGTGADLAGVPQVVKSAGTDTGRGIIVGVEVANVNAPSLAGASLLLENVAIPASKGKDYYVYVIDDPGVLFQIQDDGITTANLVAANANKNFSVTVTAGATLQSASGSVMLSSSLNTTQALNWRAIGLYQGLNNGQANAFGAFALWLCKWNQHDLNGNTVGV
jgi:hypothetical protein